MVGQERPNVTMLPEKWPVVSVYTNLVAVIDTAHYCQITSLKGQ